MKLLLKSFPLVLDASQKSLERMHGEFFLNEDLQLARLI
jgi:hypothetical protein